ncbi:MAG: hypothetical protein LBC88_05140, partial [Spirochaetaceae bacterium]|nr:hypothetical protein [Spirochaetaceae bacterium]
MKKYAGFIVLAASALFAFSACNVAWTNAPEQFFIEHTLIPYERGLVPSGYAAPGPEGVILIPPGDAALTLRLDNPRHYFLN